MYHYQYSMHIIIAPFHGSLFVSECQCLDNAGMLLLAGRAGNSLPPAS